jgi:hypothetical protein
MICNNGYETLIGAYGTQHNDTQQNWLICGTQHAVSSMVILCPIFYYYLKHHCAECRCAKCHYGECHGTHL